MKIDAEFYTNIIMQTMFMVVFLTIYFFTYVAYMEKRIVREQINILFADIKQNVSILPKELKNSLKNKLSQIGNVNTKEDDKKIDDNNKQLMKKVIIIMVVFSMICIFAILFLYTRYTVDVVSIFKHNLIIILFIAATEFIFLKYFGSLFQSADPDKIKKSIINDILNINK
jgi:hypothetical protein